MLQQLRDRTHQVLTAIALVQHPGGDCVKDVAVSQVSMRRYTDEEITAYVDRGDPLDKAGAYAIQSASFHPVEGFAGCFASVTGLPLCHLLRALRRLGFTPPADVPRACQSAYKYPCPISAAVLRGESVG
jgi:predicted house-cleaning NTP pyrophosphatase (Maf/HAM1 superfamily)